jgi:hypothetical protein
MFAEWKSISIELEAGNEESLWHRNSGPAFSLQFTARLAYQLCFCRVLFDSLESRECVKLD